MEFKKLFLISLVMIFTFSSAFGFEVYFEEGENVNLNIEEGLFHYDFNLVVDNKDWDNLVNPNNRDNSYVELKRAGNNIENIEILENFKKGVYVDQGHDYGLKVRLHLSKNERWSRNYTIEVAGVTPDGRQDIAKLNVYPQNIPKQFAPKTTNYILIIVIVIFVLGGSYLIYRLFNRKSKKSGRWS